MHIIHVLGATEGVREPLVQLTTARNLHEVLCPDRRVQQPRDTSSLAMTHPRCFAAQLLQTKRAQKDTNGAHRSVFGPSLLLRAAQNVPEALPGASRIFCNACTFRVSQDLRGAELSSETFAARRCERHQRSGSLKITGFLTIPSG